jgi:hypothetical protein
MVENYDRTLLLITEAASEALETPVAELPPLADCINLDGLDAVVGNTDADDVTVIFSYAGLRVFVNSADFVYVRPASEDWWPELDETITYSS